MEAQQVKQIILPHEASQLLNFSAKEIQKYIYLRTKLFVPIQPGETEDSFSEAILLRDDSRLSDEEYSIERVGNSLYISGGSDIAVCMAFIRMPSIWVFVFLYMVISFQTKLLQATDWIAMLKM